MIDVKSTTRGISWNIIAMAMVLPLLFGILVWQLWGLTPQNYCSILQKEGVPPGQHCFDAIMELLKIKGITIWSIVALMGLFVIVSLVAAVKAVVSLVGPGNIKLDLKTQEPPSAE